MGQREKPCKSQFLLFSPFLSPNRSLLVFAGIFPPNPEIPGDLFFFPNEMPLAPLEATAFMADHPALPGAGALLALRKAAQLDQRPAEAEAWNDVKRPRLKAFKGLFI